MGDNPHKSRRPLVLFVLILAVTGSSSTAAVARPAAQRPHTLLRVASAIRGFGQDGSRIAWLTGTDGRHCTRTLHVRSLRTRRTQTSLQTGCTSNAKHVSGLALADRAAAWDSFVQRDFSGFWADVMTAHVPQRRAHRLDSIEGGREDGYPESYPAVAGEGNLLAYSTQDDVRRIVGGKTRRLLDFTNPLGLAVSHGSVAAVGQEFRPGDGCGCNSGPVWRADGKIGFIRQLALPPQGRQQVMLTDPSGSGQNVLIDDGRWRFRLDWSLGGTKLAYSYTIGNGFSLAVADADGSGAHDVVGGDDPSLSPDGSKVAFDYWVGIFAIGVVNADGSDPHALVVGDSPDWSPDGTRVAYSASGELGVVNADGTGFHRLGLTGTRPRWSPDGTMLAYANDGIWVADADGSHARRLTTYRSDFSPDWSPDGRMLVFESNRNDLFPKDDDGLFEPELYVVNADGTGLRPLTFTVPASWATVGDVRTAAGGHVHFEAPGASAGVAFAGAKIAVGTRDDTGQGHLTLVAAATGRTLASAPLPGPAPVVVGGNERWVVFRTGARTIRAFDLRTSTSKILAVAAATPVGLSVSGRRVAWAENFGVSARIRALALSP